MRTLEHGRRRSSKTAGVCASHDGAELPRHELLVTEPQFLTLRRLAGRDANDVRQYLFAELGNRRFLQYDSAVDVHVFGHASNSALVVASFKQGTGLHPKTDPRPVVKHMTFAPPATMPVTLTGSYPGVSMKINPRSEGRCA
jgi:hypothetical protein